MIVQTTTAIDGTFHLDNVPAVTSVPILVQKGRFRRRLDMQRTRLRAPWPVTGNGHPFLDRNGPILVPLHAPVRLDGLVEQRGVDGNQIAPDDRPQVAAEPLMHQQAQDRGMADEVADAGPAAGRLRKGREQMLTLMIRESDVS